MRIDRAVLIIAEAGVNHNGNIELAQKLVEVAAEAGADVIKFQTFRSELIIAPYAPRAVYQERNTGNSEGQLEMLRKLELSKDDHLRLLEYATLKGIRFLSTPFDLESINLLRQLGLTIGKIPSGEVTNLPYLKAMARSFPELILSTGMCTLEEVQAALEVILEAGARKENITVLHCNTEYPTPMADVNLRAMITMGNAFGVHFGYSDHTLGIEVPIAAVALGATTIEKHITLDRSLPGPDHRASLEPQELISMVRSIRNIEQALGDGVKRPTPSETPNIPIARKSIHVKSDLFAGRILQEGDLQMLRPGDGISPMSLGKVIGRSIALDLKAGHKLRFEDLS